MELTFDREKMTKMMQDFYLLTGIMIVLFDRNKNTILMYPENSCDFCNRMRSDPRTKKLCDKSDSAAFEACRQKQESIVYTCHAGLTESCTPITISGQTMGYLMFGHICDKQWISTPQHLNFHLTGYLRLHGIATDQRDWLRDISFKDTEEIRAATRIVHACTSFLVMEQILKVQHQQILSSIHQYIIDHMREDITIQRLGLEFGLSRSKLYQLSKEYLGIGLGEYILSLRLEHAKFLLSTTELSIREISEECGFNDYNYFCRVFKKKFHTSAKHYRSEHNDPSSIL